MQDPVLLLRAHFALGPTLCFLGEFAPAREHLEQGIALYDTQKHRPYAFLQDPGAGCLCYVAWALWLLGYPDQALQRIHEAVTLAQKLSHPHSLAFALNFAALVHQFRRERQAAQEQAEATIALATEQGFMLWLAQGTVTRGWALAEQGQAEGITQRHQGVAAWRATGAEVWRPYYLARLAEAYGKTGQAEEGLTALADALVQVDKTGERCYEAELYRLKGELTLQKLAVASDQLPVTTPQPPTPNPPSEAEACFLKTIEIARKQQAKSLELRAATSLARLWQQQGKRAEARDLLAPIYGWFTEGFDMADLQDAKALMEELEG